MGKGRRPDPRKRKQHGPHSDYLQVPNKTKCGGWKAGEVYGLYTHHAGHTKPCIDDVTQGAMKCPLCEAGFDLTFRAYMPLWDREFTLRHVLLGEDVFDAADLIPFRHPITLSRAASMRSPLKVSDEPFMVRMLPDGPPWDKPIDMIRICLTIWKDDALSLWMHSQLEKPVSDNPLSLTKSDGEAFGPMTAAAARRWAKPATKPEPVTAGAEVDRLLKHVAETTHNGNGKPKPKG